jgi:alpha-tubulin suppressor-like RCC1 family protein
MKLQTVFRSAPLVAAAAAVLAACADQLPSDAGGLAPRSPRLTVIPATAYTAIDGGFTYACGLASSGQAYCWGRNPYGNLGDSSATNSSVPVTVFQLGVSFSSITAGDSHACALTSAGQAYCWGYNADSRLGDSTFVLPLRPVAVLPLGGVTFTSINAGYSQTCGLVSSGQAYCWGSNSWGQLGDSTLTFAGSPTAVHQPAGVTFTQIQGGKNFTCALASGGQAYCWGYGAGGALGNNSVSTQRIPVTVQQPAGVSFTGVYTEYDHTCAIDTGGQAYCWGNNGWGQLGDNTTTTRRVPVAVQQPAGVTFTQLAPGGAFTCGLTSGGQAYCWGNNTNGQLGNGTLTSSLLPVAVSQPAGVTFTTIRAEQSGVCGLDGNGQTWCWGYNAYGSLGDGTTTRRTSPVAVAH